MNLFSVLFFKISHCATTLYSKAFQSILFFIFNNSEKKVKKKFGAIKKLFQPLHCKQLTNMSRIFLHKQLQNTFCPESGYNVFGACIAAD